MKGGKLFAILTSLSPAEMKALKKVVQSPIYNTNERMWVLYEELKRWYGKVQKLKTEEKEKTSERNPLPMPDKEKLFKAVFPNEVFSNYKIHRLMTEMTQVVEEYLLLLDQRHNTQNSQKRLLLIYRDRELNSHFKQVAQTLQQQLDQTEDWDLDYFQTRLFLNKITYFHPATNKYNLKQANLNLLIDNLDRYFVLAKMRYGLALKNQERLFNNFGTWRFWDAIQASVNSGFSADSVLLQLYRLAHDLLAAREDADFEQYEDLVFNNLDRFSGDWEILLSTGINYSIWQVNRGNSEFSVKALKWYKLGLDKEILIENGIMPEAIFGNIVIAALREEEFEWAEWFMENYIQYVNINHRADISTYHLGLSHFYKKEYKQAYTILVNYSFVPAYYLRSRLTVIRAIFEEYLQDSLDADFVLAHIVAYEKALGRNQLFTPLKIQPHLNFLAILKKIINRKQTGKIDDDFKIYLTEEINKDSSISAKKWLLEKTNQSG